MPCSICGGSGHNRRTCPRIHNELIRFSDGSPGKYLTNQQYWLDMSTTLREKLEIKLTNKIEALKLAKEITD